MCSSYFESTKYTYLMCINHFCMTCSVFEDDESVADSRSLESRQFGGLLPVMFLRENDKIN